MLAVTYSQLPLSSSTMQSYPILLELFLLPQSNHMTPSVILIHNFVKQQKKLSNVQYKLDFHIQVLK